MQFHSQHSRPVSGLAITLALMLFLLWQNASGLNAQAQSFTFSAVGDYGATTNTDIVLTGIANSGAAFNLALGDLSYGTLSPELSWCNYVQSKVGATFPFELISGNHDMDAQPTGHINTFATCLPNRVGNLTGTYGKQYYFDYQNLARFILISPNLTLDGETYAYNVGAARYNWLVSAIDGARAANIPWVIVGMHKNCITTGVKSCEIGADLFNLLISKKVDLVLQGHDHNYQRSKQLALNANCTTVVPGQYAAPCVIDDGADNAYTKSAGMVLTIVGTGGQSLYASNPFDTEAGYFARIVNPGVDVARYGFLKVNVTSSQLSAQFVGTSPGSTFGDAFVVQGASTNITLAAFHANAVAPRRVRIAWATANEVKVRGFNLWRRISAHGTFKKINAALIPAEQSGQMVGASYLWRDRHLTPGTTYLYKLQIVYMDDTVEWSNTARVKLP